jgi:FtsH-binding integral membrane protein
MYVTRLRPWALVAVLLALSVPTFTAAAPAQAAPLTPAVATGASLESAATKAGETGRKVAMSMIALGFAIASVVLAFRRDFKEAAGVFAIGIVAILLATPAGVNVLHDTVNTLFGG